MSETAAAAAELERDWPDWHVWTVRQCIGGWCGAPGGGTITSGC